MQRTAPGPGPQKPRPPTRIFNTLASNRCPVPISPGPTSPISCRRSGCAIPRARPWSRRTDRVPAVPWRVLTPSSRAGPVRPRVPGPRLSRPPAAPAGAICLTPPPPGGLPTPGSPPPGGTARPQKTSRRTPPAIESPGGPVARGSVQQVVSGGRSQRACPFVSVGSPPDKTYSLGGRAGRLGSPLEDNRAP